MHILIELYKKVFYRLLSCLHVRGASDNGSDNGSK